MGGHGQRWGPHPARRGRIPPSVIHGGESWWRRGEHLAVPSRPNRTGTGPAGGIPGGRAGLGTGALGPGSREFAGRRGGDRAGPRAAAGEGGAWEGRAGSGANPERPSGAGRGLPRAAAPWGGWVGLGQGLIRTSGTTDIALPCASQLVRRVHGCPVSRPTGLMTAPVPRGGTRGREMPPCLCVWGSVSPGAPGPGGEAGGA